MNFSDLDIFDFFYFYKENWISEERIFIKSSHNNFIEIYEDGETREWKYEFNIYLDTAIVNKF